MMPTSFTPHGSGHALPVAAPGQHYACQCSPFNVATPCKRPAGGDNDDDDIQFISEKPVKRRRFSERPPAISMSQQPAIPPAAIVVPPIPTAQMQMGDADQRDTERRLSTGMVGFPSDLHAMELTYALRGVSMPVLENFVLNQPPRKPRPLSPPELSPKQLPSKIPSSEPNVPPNQHRSRITGYQASSTNSPTACSSRSRTPCQAETQAATPNLTRSKPTSGQVHTSEPLVNSRINNTLCSSHPAKTNCLRGTPMPPPPPLPPIPTPTLPCPESSQHATCPDGSPKTSENHHHHHNSSAQTPKQPCQACSRLRHQAQLSRAQGLPMMNAPLPPHFISQLPFRQPYGQQVHPQVMAMSTSNMHQFGPNYASLMMPLTNSPFAPLPSHPPHQPPAQQAMTNQSKNAGKAKQRTPEPAGKTQSPKTSQPGTTTTGPKATSSPAKPPTSIIKPTYRKPSPNLIVDVAETCQEKFPFEEVAKRHNVTVEKVFDVFAAIIQVPLLRCPTDRRRAGRLATARIKEYNKAKKAAQDAKKIDAGKTSGGGEVDKQETSMDIAKRLGPVDLPEGLMLGERSYGNYESTKCD
ncbi:hypothetical protein GGS21DRAFT_276733 [Xylaria nigripes]|nr:hypothetical protein GGS21DRAFT_276733 [Xylaria nigripes]